MSWVGQITAYVAALILLAKHFKELGDLSKQIAPAAPSWMGIAIIAAFPLLALVFHTIPSLIEQRRIKRYAQISGTLRPGYFTLRPREDEDAFDRADNAHQEILHWIQSTKEPVLYLTGASGTGKSSLLASWVIPKLRRSKHVVIRLRGYDDVLARIEDEILHPSVIWERPPANTDDLHSLLERACVRLGDKRLMIVVDQFEEMLISSDTTAQQALQRLLSREPVDGLTFLLVYRPEYEGLLQGQSWPVLRLDANRRVISPFTEKAAGDFLGKSGLAVDDNLARAVLREAAELEQGTTGLIRPVTINLCGLVLGRFSSGLPRKFRGGLVRGFLRESLELPEVRDTAAKLIPQLISPNITKRPRTVLELATQSLLPSEAVRACVRRLGEPDRAIVRPLDQQQDVWEISHDFLVPLLDAILARRTASIWRTFRPWLPWTAATLIGIGAILAPQLSRSDPLAALAASGWIVSRQEGKLMLKLGTRNIQPQSIPVIRRLSEPFSIDLNSDEMFADRKILKASDFLLFSSFKNLTSLDISYTEVTDLSFLRGLTNLAVLDFSFTAVKSLLPLRDLGTLKKLRFHHTPVKDLSPLRDLKGLTDLDFGATNVNDISPLRDLSNLTSLEFIDISVPNVAPLAGLKKLASLELRITQQNQPIDISDLINLKSLKKIDLMGTKVDNYLVVKRDLERMGVEVMNGEPWIPPSH